MWWQIFKRFWHCDKTNLIFQTKFDVDMPDKNYTAKICKTIKLDDLYLKGGIMIDMIFMDIQLNLMMKKFVFME